MKHHISNLLSGRLNCLSVFSKWTTTFTVTVLMFFSIRPAESAVTLMSIPIAQFETHGSFENAANSSFTLTVPPGSRLVAASYENLQYQSFGESYASELILSLNDGPTALRFWDTTIVGAPDVPGVFGPVSALFSPNQSGGPFTITTGELYISVYESFDDPGMDARILSGEIYVFIEPIPEPGIGMLSLIGGSAILARRRIKR